MEFDSVQIAFYKGGNKFVHKIVRWWTKSPYSHAELIMPDGKTWVSISPFLNSRVTLRVRDNSIKRDNWDFITLPLSWRAPVKAYQVSELYRFIEETQGSKYDWTGMILSQLTPFLVKKRNKWYCSEWIAHALVKSRIISWSHIRIYDTPNMSPAKLHQIVSAYKPEYK